MANVKTYRDLIAWQKGMDLTVAVYHLTEQMPKSEQFGLTSQMRRAAASIPSNVAEGFGRESRPDLLRFLRISRGSLFELGTQLELAQRLNMLSADEPIAALVEEEDRIIQALIRSLERKTD